eukprot:gene9720-8362_t
MFLRGFVHAWERTRPHLVTLRDAQGNVERFHATDEWWRRSAEPLLRRGQPPFGAAARAEHLGHRRGESRACGGQRP